jgi:hypothetical protein
LYFSDSGGFGFHCVILLNSAIDSWSGYSLPSSQMSSTVLSRCTQFRNSKLLMYFDTAEKGLRKGEYEVKCSPLHTSHFESCLRRQRLIALPTLAAERVPIRSPQLPTLMTHSPPVKRGTPFAYLSTVATLASKSRTNFRPNFVRAFRCNIPEFQCNDCAAKSRTMSESKRASFRDLSAA